MTGSRIAGGEEAQGYAPDLLPRDARASHMGANEWEDVMTPTAGMREAGHGIGARGSDRGLALRKTLRKPQFWFGVSVLAPTFIWYAIFSYWPILQAFWLAVTRYQLLQPVASPFVGTDNFQQLFNNPLFLPAVGNTLLWTVLEVALMLPLSLLVSVCLANVIRGRQLYQAVLFVPVVTSLVAVVLLFRMLLDPDVGQINTILYNLGLPTSTFLTGSSTALPTAAAIGAWKGLGFYIIVLTAGLLNIPRELSEAALVDGANEWQRFWRMTLPLLGHTLALVMILLVIGAVQEFTLPFVLTGGGPDNATLLLNMLIYNEAFQNLHFGIASAAALLEFALILVVSILQLRFFRPKWSY